MFSTVFGLPAHPLVIHAVVVLVPLAALSGIVVAVWPAARARYSVLALAVATAALISVPVATHTGEELEPHVRHTALLEQHTHMADGLLPFAGLMWLALLVLVLVQRYGAARWMRYAGIAASVVAVAAAVGSGVQVVRIGHSGAEAAWHGVATSGHSGRAAGPGH